MKYKYIFAKLDPGFFTNRKIIRAGRNGRDVYMHVLCMNAHRGALGFVPIGDVDPWYVARLLGITEQEATEGIEAAIEAGLLTATDDRITIAGWDDEWARKALTRSEIQENYRARKKGDGAANPVTSQVTTVTDEVTAEVTAPEKRYRKSNAVTLLPRDQRDQRDQRERVERGNAGPASPDSLAGFAPSAEARQIAAERGLDLAHELAQFRDAIANGKAPRNPDAAFRKWLRGSRDARPRAAGAVKAATPQALAVSASRLMDRVAYYAHGSDGNDVEISEAEYRAARGEQP